MSHLHHGTYDPTIVEASDWWKASNFGTIEIAAWTFVRQFSDCGCLDSYTNNFSSAHTSPVISLSGLSGQRVIT